VPKKKREPSNGYLFENKGIQLEGFGAESARLAPCIPLFAGNFCTFA
jgi:hypothetical protein